MSFVVRVAKYAAKYGTKAVKWVWNHKWEIISLGEAAFDLIREMFG